MYLLYYNEIISGHSSIKASMLQLSPAHSVIHFKNERWRTLITERARSFPSLLFCKGRAASRVFPGAYQTRDKIREQSYTIGLLNFSLFRSQFQDMSNSLTVCCAWNFLLFPLDELHCRSNPPVNV